MQPQEYNLVVKRLHRFERRTRWHWAERVLTLGLAARLLLIGPAGTSLRDKARLQAQRAAENTRLALAESMAAARRALVVRPALDPQRVLEDQREAALDAMPMPPAVTAPVQAAPAAMASVTPAPLHQQAALLTQQRPTFSATSPSLAAAPAAAAKAAPLTAFQRTEAFSSGVSDAERQMARAAERSAEPLASLIDGPFAGATPALNGAVSAALGFPMPDDLAVPEKLWKAVGRTGAHKGIASGRDPFSFAGPFAAQSDRLARVQTEGLRGSQSEPLAPGSAVAASASAMQSPEVVAPATSPAATAPLPPVVNLKALGYALSADGNAQAVLSGGNTLYVVNEGEEFADRFRVTSIRPEYLEVEDELTNQIIRLPLGE
ncbi:MAG TPA: hypothetical protein VMT20_20195 [Terriglobia bacterium]|nr:hypothetical protein [Terriglobia bacterium]